MFINTSIEYLDILKFVKDLASKDDRFVILNSGINIKNLLEQYGYPFKSKEHSSKLYDYKQGGRAPNVLKYKNNAGMRYCCPKILLYQFNDDFNIKISHKCCLYLKKKPAHNWAKQNGKTIILTGMRKDEGGQRKNIKGCVLTDKKGRLKRFHPLLVVNDDFEDWFIDQYNIELCKLYYPPYNFKRTGCKGCPFNLDLQQQLDVMKNLLPNEYKQCEVIWKPVYDEYRRINYRLRNQMTIYDFIVDD